MSASHGRRPDARAAPDDELVRRVQEDPENAEGRAAAGELLSRHRGRVYLWCFRYVRDHDRALDLAQEVLLSAWRSLPRFERRANFTSWLFAIARNRCRTAMRSRIRVRDEDVTLDDLLDPAPGPEARVLNRDEEQRVLEMIREHLDPIEQQAVWMRCVEELPIDEVTRALGIAQTSGARGLLQRARRKLRAALGRGDPDERTPPS